MTTPSELQQLIHSKKRRLQLLKEQAALKGIDTPPYVSIEIEDLTQEIDDLGTQLEEIEPGASLEQRATDHSVPSGDPSEMLTQRTTKRVPVHAKPKARRPDQSEPVKPESVLPTTSGEIRQVEKPDESVPTISAPLGSKNEGGLNWTKIGAIATIITVVIAAAAFFISTEFLALFSRTPTPAPVPTTPATPASFSYLVHVQDKSTGNNIERAEVTIEIGGKAPINGLTDSNGMARIFIPAEFAGQPGRVLVEAAGYKNYRQEFDISEGVLPKDVPLEPDVPAPTDTPAPTPTEKPVSGETRGDELKNQPSTEPPPVEPVPSPLEPPPGMVQVSAGLFLMGSLEDSSGLPGIDRPIQPDPDEFPQRKVALPDFWIDRTEVSNARYRDCVAAGVCEPQKGGDPNYHNLDDFPVIFVSWEDAQTYCQWAGKRLPTEAEWEKAARGTDGRIWPWGNALKDDLAAPVSRANVGDGAENGLTEVDSFPNGASPYGALNMTGNVWEWVADWYSPTYYQSRPNPDESPMGPSESQSNRQHVMRGGSFRPDGVHARTAERNTYNQPGDDIGFRCAWSSP